MKAVLVGAQGKLEWRDVPDPVLKDGDVLLEIHATALNRADLLQRAGQYPPPPDWPAWFGLEAAGVIRALSPAAQAENKWHVGDAVCALLGGGGYAEYVAVPSGMLMPVPKGLTMEEAASLPEVYGAAYLFLFYEGGLKAGETVLVTAGASGLASALIPMARSFGARVLTTVLNEETARSIADLGADRIIDTSRQRLPEIMKEELEAGRGVDMVIDCLGGSDVGECMPYLNCWGRWIMIATLADDFTQVNLRSMYVRRTRLIGTTLRSRSSAEKSEILSCMVRDLWPMLESGRIRPKVYRVLPIQEAEAAHSLMASGKHVGKIVLKVR